MLHLLVSKDSHVSNVRHIMYRLNAIGYNNNEDDFISLSIQSLTWDYGLLSCLYKINVYFV